MRKAGIIILVSILIYFLFFPNSTCLGIGMGKFESVEEKTAVERLPMSETEPGIYRQYRTTITFRNDQFSQQESDYFFSGPYVCRFGKIVAYPFSGGTVSGNYNPFSRTLLWDGQLYRYAPLP